MTHWKALQNPAYLGAYSLQPGEEPVYTIANICAEIVTGPDGKQEECTVAHFSENVKPMILNATNCKTIAKMYKTPYIDGWKGKKIRIYATTVRAFGEEVEALRIRPKIPESKKPVLDKSYKGWDSALAALKNNETTIEYLKTKYTISPETEKTMREVINA